MQQVADSPNFNLEQLMEAECESPENDKEILFLRQRVQGLSTCVPRFAWSFRYAEADTLNLHRIYETMRRYKFNKVIPAQLHIAAQFFI